MPSASRRLASPIDPQSAVVTVITGNSAFFCAKLVGGLGFGAGGPELGVHAEIPGTKRDSAGKKVLKESAGSADNTPNHDHKRGSRTMSDAVIEHTNETGMRTALGTLLIEAGFVDSARLDEALRIGADTGERLGEVVVRMGWATEDDLAKTLAEQWHLRYLERSAITFDADALSRMSREEASRLEALPMKVSEDGAVVVALAEPTDARLLALRSLLGDRIDCVVVAKTAIDAGLRSDLLAKQGKGTPTIAEPEAEAETEPEAEVGESHHDTGLVLVTDDVSENENETTAETAAEPIAEAEEVGAANFDEVASTLTDALGAQLASLRGIVVEAETRREADRNEIARLEAELADRNTDLADRAGELAQKGAELTDRNETIRDMQQKLRELADTLEHKA
jgi:hypothetical protein